MIYLDNGATSFVKPPQVYRAVQQAMVTCASPGRGSYGPARSAEETVYVCRDEAAKLFHCAPEQVVMTMNGTHGLNIAIRSLFSPGDRVVISGFEHNAVTRPLHGLGAQVAVAGQKLFDWNDTLEAFEAALDQGANGAVFTHVSNVFGYILPIGEMAAMCRSRGVPFVVDAAQSAGTMALDFEKLGAAFLAMPGHKGLLGPQGTGLLLCRDSGRPLLRGGTGSLSIDQEMPDFLPDAQEAGTHNVPGIAGLAAGIRFVRSRGPETIGALEHRLTIFCAEELQKMGMQVFAGPHQAGTLSFCTGLDCQQTADVLGQAGFALRAGLHCAPLAHYSAGTIRTGTVRASFGWNGGIAQAEAFLRAVSKLLPPAV